MERDFGPRRCSVARALAVFSDTWTFVVLREAFFGVRRFDEFQRNLGISRNVLTKRLMHLTERGIFERRPYQQAPVRYEYRLTDKGLAMYPIFVTLMAWGDRWADDGNGPPLLLQHQTCGTHTQATVVCSHCHKPLDAHQMRYHPGPGATDTDPPPARSTRSVKSPTG